MTGLDYFIIVWIIVGGLTSGLYFCIFSKETRDTFPLHLIVMIIIFIITSWPFNIYYIVRDLYLKKFKGS